jgi:formylmethanofuran dehydrogenase subunit E
MRRAREGPPFHLSEEWIALGARVHGAFGAFIPLGIRIGLDAIERLQARPRDLAVTYYDSEKSPCACFADGIACRPTDSYTVEAVP